jgi:hypothetical protein
VKSVRILIFFAWALEGAMLRLVFICACIGTAHISASMSKADDTYTFFMERLFFIVSTKVHNDCLLCNSFAEKIILRRD